MALTVSKANVYAVLSVPFLAVSKANVYAVLTAAVWPSWPSFTFGGGVVGVAYSQTFAANGTPPITYSIASGSLPTGLTLGAGVISGTPSVAGTYSFTLRATNAYGTADQATSITVVTAAGGGGGSFTFIG